nr:hypothetical protein JVH1_0743 [Rhodococcus sp. JVH1]
MFPWSRRRTPLIAEKFRIGRVTADGPDDHAGRAQRSAAKVASESVLSASWKRQDQI